jgi:hypothetical protein
VTAIQRYVKQEGDARTLSSASVRARLANALKAVKSGRLALELVDDAAS